MISFDHAPLGINATSVPTPIEITPRMKKPNGQSSTLGNPPSFHAAPMKLSVASAAPQLPSHRLLMACEKIFSASSAREFRECLRPLQVVFFKIPDPIFPRSIFFAHFGPRLRATQDRCGDNRDQLPLWLRLPLTGKLLRLCDLCLRHFSFQCRPSEYRCSPALRC